MKQRNIAKKLRIYLDPDMRKLALDEKFNFVNRIRNVLERRGFFVEIRRNSELERIKAMGRKGYALYLMDDPAHETALTMRKSYFFPYWRIENTGKRWEFDVALKTFSPEEIPQEDAEVWCANWRKWLFRGKVSDPTTDGPIYVPLQGKLLDHRSFQTCSPMDMVRAVLAAFPERQVMVGLHPGEQYSERELAAVNALDAAHENLRIQTGGMEEALAICPFVVTQNSSAALNGFFFHKPAILFAKIDFHHIALKVEEMGAQAAFDAVESHQPAFDKYLYWFQSLNAIKADAPDAEAQIAQVLRRHEWIE